MKIKILTLLILHFIFNSLLSAQPNQVWVSCYNGPGNGDDIANSIAVDALGNVYVTGKSVGSGTGNDYAIIKYNSLGTMLWSARYNGIGSGDDEPKSMVVDGAGNVYVTGKTEGGTGYDSYTTIKYDSQGGQQWAVNYRTSNYPTWGIMSTAYSIAIDGSGNVYVTGSENSTVIAVCATIKYNSAGVQQWIQSSDLSGYLNSIAVDASGFVYVTGNTTTFDGTVDYQTVKYNPAGSQQWVQFYDGPSNGIDIATSLVLDGSGNVYITGSSIGTGTAADYATIKYNNAGVQQWVARYNGPADSTDVATSIKVDGSGNVYVTGYSEGIGTYSDYATVKYNSSGIEQWVIRYDGPVNLHDKASSIVIDESGNAYVSGSSWGTGTDLDYTIIKYSSSGVQEWVQRYNGAINSADEANAMVLDGAGNIYVTGSAAGNGSLKDYATVKYSQQSSDVFEHTVDNSLFLYPNPATNVVSVAVTNPNIADLTLKIYNVIGTMIKSEKLKRGQQEINVGDLSIGVYIVEIGSNEWTEKQKLIIQR